MHPSTPPRPDLDGIEARANAAMPGPWRPGAGDTLVTDANGGANVVFPQPEESYHSFQWWPANEAFLYHARQDVPALVAYARSLEARVKLLGELAERLANGMAHMDQCQECGDGSASDCPWGGMEAMRALQAYNDSIPELNCHGGAV